MKILLRIITGFVLYASFSAAQAEYVCRASYIPNSLSMGDYGYAFATFFTGRNCTGTFVASYRFCTKNPVAWKCPALSYYYSEAAIMGIYNTLVIAARDGIRVSIIRTDCIDGSLECLSHINVIGN